MKKIFRIILSLSIVFSFTSCIDLIEEVTVNENLSGHYELRLETDGLGNLMNMGGQYDIPAIKELNEKVNLLRHQEGISNVKKKIEPKRMKLYVSFDFEDAKAFNNAMYNLAEIEPNIFIKKLLKIKKHKVVRPNLNPYLQRLVEEQNLMEQLPSKDLLRYVNYKLIVNTPTDIRRVSSNRAMVQSNKRTVISSYSFQEILINNASTQMKIKM